MSDGLGGGRLKKLFRTSKAGAVDPLPVPEAASVAQQPSFQQQPKPLSAHHLDLGRRKHPQVSPFPLDVGRTDHPPPPLGPPQRTSTRPTGSSGTGGTVTPTLGELRQMEEEAAAAQYRREPGDRVSFPVPARSRRGTGSSAPSAMDAASWPQGMAPGSAPAPPRHPSNGHDQAYTASYAAFLAAQPPPPGQPSPPLQHGYYLPPGAGPPSAHFRPSTPPRLGHIQQASIPDAPAFPPPLSASYGGDLDGDYASGRSRGYSSASQSGRGSDHEGSVHHMASSPMASMLGKPPASNAPSRSPLGMTQSLELNKQLPQPVAQPPPHNFGRGSREEPKSDKLDKDKGTRRFWPAWGERKARDKQRDGDAGSDRGLQVNANIPKRSSAEEKRPSFDEWRDADVSNHGHASSVGHSLESSHRAQQGFQVRGFEIGTRRDPEINGIPDLGTAIRVLCSTPETTDSGILELCDRINMSDPSDVAKDAVRSLRKVFKSGSDSERRMAGCVWRMTMVNVKMPGYRAYATNKKILSVIGDILTFQTRPPASQSTYKLLMTTLSSVVHDYHGEKGCEGLHELWTKVKRPDDPEFGSPLPPDSFPRSQPTHPERRRDHAHREHRDRERRERDRGHNLPLPPPISSRSPRPSPPASLQSGRPGSVPLSTSHVSRTTMPTSPLMGPPYSHLPDHHDDMSKLIQESNAAKETALVLSNTLAYISPLQLSSNALVQDLHRRCLLAQESLTNQMNWAQSEAERSRRIADSVVRSETGSAATMEESALALLLDAHSLISDTLAQYNDLDEKAAEERQYLEAQERSKTDTRMNRQQHMDMLSAPEGATMASGSRSPSPARHMRLPPEQPALLASSRPEAKRADGTEAINKQLESTQLEPRRSNSPASDHPLPPPPKITSPLPRSSSPLGRSRMTGPRPLPNPFKTVNSHPNLVSAAAEHRAPSRGASGSSKEGVSNGSGADGDEDEDFVPARPSRKALGKRRAIPREDDFDPNEWTGGGAPKQAPEPEEVTADDLLAKPIKYAYDAWAEAVARERDEATRVRRSVGPTPPPTVPTMNHSHPAPDVTRAVSAR